MPWFKWGKKKKSLWEDIDKGCQCPRRKGEEPWPDETTN